jgi:hypothetical protein
VTSRDITHIVDAHVLASPAELMRAIRRGSLEFDEAMFTNLQTFIETPARKRYVHVIEPDSETVGDSTVDPAPLSEAEVAWKLAQMAWRSAVRLWPAGADPTKHSQAVLDSIAYGAEDRRRWMAASVRRIADGMAHREWVTRWHPSEPIHPI